VLGSSATSFSQVDHSGSSKRRRVMGSESGSTGAAMTQPSASAGSNAALIHTATSAAQQAAAAAKAAARKSGQHAQLDQLASAAVRMSAAETTAKQGRAIGSSASSDSMRSSGTLQSRAPPGAGSTQTARTASRAAVAAEAAARAAAAATAAGRSAAAA